MLSRSGSFRMAGSLGLELGAGRALLAQCPRRVCTGGWEGVPREAGLRQPARCREGAALGAWGTWERESPCSKWSSVCSNKLMTPF